MSKTSFRDLYPTPWEVRPIPAPGYGVYDATGRLILPIYAANPERDHPNAHWAMPLAHAKVFAEAIVEKLGS